MFAKTFDRGSQRKTQIAVTTIRFFDACRCFKFHIDDCRGDYKIETQGLKLVLKSSNLKSNPNLFLSGMLLTLSQNERKTVSAGLQQHYQNHAADIDAIDHLLMSTPDEYTMLTRLQKDLLHGEFNICLHNLAYTNSVGEALTLMENNIANLSE